jgi:hypothetical protein
MDPVSRLIQLCYNPLPTRPPNAPLGVPFSIFRHPRRPDLRRVALSGVAEAEHAFVSNPVYDRGHTACQPSHRNLPVPLDYYDLVESGPRASLKLTSLSSRVSRERERNLSERKLRNI